jgi:gas vesicle structural protein
MSDPRGAQDVSVVDLLDRLLDKGVVLAGDITISVADVPLVYLGLRVLLSSAETAERFGAPVPGGRALASTSLRKDALGATPRGDAFGADALDADALDADVLDGDALDAGLRPDERSPFPPSQPDAGGIDPGQGRR